jgi:hypothetical protein
MHSIPDKAEVGIDFPDKFYIGGFGRDSGFEAKAEEDAVLIRLVRSGGEKRVVEVHLHHFLLANILNDLAMTFDIEKALMEAGVYTPEDTIMIRNIGAMGVRPTQIMMYHNAPGEVWWDGLMRVSHKFVEYVDTSVTPRLGAEKTKEWVSWIPEYEERMHRLRAAQSPK